jgi:hypothetical protein
VRLLIYLTVLALGASAPADTARAAELGSVHPSGLHSSMSVASTCTSTLAGMDRSRGRKVKVRTGTSRPSVWKKFRSRLGARPRGARSSVLSAASRGVARISHVGPHVSTVLRQSVSSNARIRVRRRGASLPAGVRRPRGVAPGAAGVVPGRSAASAMSNSSSMSAANSPGRPVKVVRRRAEASASTSLRSTVYQRRAVLFSRSNRRQAPQGSEAGAEPTGAEGQSASLRSSLGSRTHSSADGDGSSSVEGDSAYGRIIGGKVVMPKGQVKVAAGPPDTQAILESLPTPTGNYYNLAVIRSILQSRQAAGSAADGQITRQSGSFSSRRSASYANVLDALLDDSGDSSASSSGRNLSGSAVDHSSQGRSSFAGTATGNNYDSTQAIIHPAASLTSSSRSSDSASSDALKGGQ